MRFFIADLNGLNGELTVQNGEGGFELGALFLLRAVAPRVAVGPEKRAGLVVEMKGFINA